MENKMKFKIVFDWKKTTELPPRKQWDDGVEQGTDVIAILKKNGELTYCECFNGGFWIPSEYADDMSITNHRNIINEIEAWALYPENSTKKGLKWKFKKIRN